MPQDVLGFLTGEQVDLAQLRARDTIVRDFCSETYGAPAESGEAGLQQAVGRAAFRLMGRLEAVDDSFAELRRVAHLSPVERELLAVIDRLLPLANPYGIRLPDNNGQWVLAKADLQRVQKRLGLE
jgi:hypothetical protein